MDKSKISEIDYQAYLHSTEWQAKREQRLQQDGHKCTHCFTTECLEVHHLTYVRLGNELLDDLLTLCDYCHQDLHGVSQSNFGRLMRRQDVYRRIFVETYGPFPHSCHFCGKTVPAWRGKITRSSPVVHHLDEDPFNNEPYNLVPAHNGCHSRYHKLGNNYHKGKRWPESYVEQRIG